MNKRLLSLAVAGAMVLGLTGLASAGIPDDTLSSASSAAGAIMISPAGTGPSLASAGLTVTVTVLDATSTPIAGYAFQDMYLDDNSNGDIALCQGGSTADGNTDVNGVATFSGAISGGGNTQNGLRVFLAGTPVVTFDDGVNPPAPGVIPIDVVSPDIDGSLVVNASDLGTFAIDFGSASYTFRSDMTTDGLINVADVGAFALRLGETCP